MSGGCDVCGLDYQVRLSLRIRVQAKSRLRSFPLPFGCEILPNGPADSSAVTR